MPQQSVYQHDNSIIDIKVFNRAFLLTNPLFNLNNRLKATKTI